jgi:hypothetical protein
MSRHKSKNTTLPLMRLHFRGTTAFLLFVVCALLGLATPGYSSPSSLYLTSEASDGTNAHATVNPLVESFTELKLKQNLYTGTKGTPLSFGSGVSFLTNSQGKSVFVGLTDRGPNILAPDDLGRPTTYLLLEEVFAPALVPFLLEGDEITPITWNRFLEIIRGEKVLYPVGGRIKGTTSYAAPLLNSSGEQFDGIPLADSGQVSVTPKLIGITPTGRGIDPEGITILPNLDQIWISEEYGPSILVFDLTTRKLLKRFDPGHGLPNIFSKRKMNRGFEGIAALKDGSVVTALQSPLSIDGSEEDCLRLIVISPDTIGMSMDELRAFSDYKLGELTFAEGETLIAVESYENSENRKIRNIISIDLSTTKIGSSPVCTSDPSLPSVKRKKILDMSIFGRKFGKIEGLSLLPDKRTLIVTEDTDFGVELLKKGRKGADISIPGSVQSLSIKDSQTKIYRIVFREEFSKLTHGF